MREGWIPLECADCGEQWENNPADLPSPGNEFECDHCDARRPVSEFVATTEGLNVLKDFHRSPTRG